AGGVRRVRGGAGAAAEDEQQGGRGQKGGSEPGSCHGGEARWLRVRNALPGRCPEAGPSAIVGRPCHARNPACGGRNRAGDSGGPAASVWPVRPPPGAPKKGPKKR